MTEMDPIVKTVCFVLIATAIFIAVLIALNKNNPVIAQIFLSSMERVTDALTGYYNRSFYFLN